MGSTGNLDWNDLRHFLAAARAGTLAGAARDLGVKHSTVGRRLTALEGALGGALFLRGPEGLRLTPLGEKLVPLAEGIERSANALQEEVSAETARVRFAVLTGCMTLFSPRMEKFRRSHPEISIEFVSSTRQTDLHKDDADLAMRVGRIRDERLLARKVADAGWSLYASPEYLERKAAPSNPRELAGHELVGFGDDLAWLEGAQWLVEHGKNATVAIQAQEPADLVAAAVAGVGLAVLPCVVANTDLRLKRLTPEVLCRTPLSVVYRREALQAKPVQIVVRFVLDVLRAESKTIHG